VSCKFVFVSFTERPLVPATTLVTSNAKANMTKIDAASRDWTLRYAAALSDDSEEEMDASMKTAELHPSEIVTNQYKTAISALASAFDSKASASELGLIRAQLGRLERDMHFDRSLRSLRIDCEKQFRVAVAHEEISDSEGVLDSVSDLFERADAPSTSATSTSVAVVMHDFSTSKTWKGATPISLLEEWVRKNLSSKIGSRLYHAYWVPHCLFILFFVLFW
jgi:hypothetical protein